MSLICSVEIDDEDRRLRSRKLRMTASAMLMVVSNGMEDGRTNSSSEHSRYGSALPQEAMLTDGRCVPEGS